MDIFQQVISEGLKIRFNNKPKNFKCQQLNNNCNDIFGVFVSIERSKEQSLKKYPKNIHGCLGYWDQNYLTLSEDLIKTKLIQLAYDTTWHDDRRLYFKHSLYTDLNAKYKIYYMVKPINKINENTGNIENLNEFFDNDKYGIIVQNSNGNKATYLPKVWENKDWKFIKSSILEKAQINNTEDLQFLSYRAEIFTKSIKDYLFEPIISFINKYYHKFVPYEIVNKKLYTKKNEDVRNLATIYDIIKLKEYGYLLNNNVLNTVKNNIEYYKSKYIKYNFRQASAFLLLILNYIDKNDPLINTIVEKLYDQLNDLEKQFELGEVLMSLSMVKPKYTILIDKAYQILNKEISNEETKKDDIFRLNWHSKFFLTLRHTDFKNQKNELIKFTNRFVKIINLFDENEETNYYAVAFEGLTSLYNLLDNDEKIFLEIYIENLFIKLNNRKNHHGLYKFTNSDIRLDITGHVMNGYFNLLNSNKVENEIY